MSEPEINMIASLLSLSLGIGLSAACGFRVFVPLLIMNLAARGEWLTLGDRFQWIASDAALVAAVAATVLEIGAYYIPWLDNLLDLVATPAAVIAGILVTASVVTGMSPLLRWSLAVIAGGGAAAAVQSVTVAGRQASSVMTAGFGNPLLSTIESGSAVALSLMAIVAPLLAVVLTIVMALVIGRWVRRRRSVVTA